VILGAEGCARGKVLLMLQASSWHCSWCPTSSSMGNLRYGSPDRATVAPRCRPLLQGRTQEGLSGGLGPHLNFWILGKSLHICMKISKIIWIC
jgi:hypothetical protein